jgi:hypothetical protein
LSEQDYEEEEEEDGDEEEEEVNERDGEDKQTSGGGLAFSNVVPSASPTTKPKREPRYRECLLQRFDMESIWKEKLFFVFTNRRKEEREGRGGRGKRGCLFVCFITSSEINEVETTQKLRNARDDRTIPLCIVI